MMFSFDKKIILLFSSILIGIVVTGIVTFRNSESVRDTDYLVQRTREVLYETVEVFSLAQDIVLSSRGYIITGDTAFLQPFSYANSQVNKHIDNLENLVKDDALQYQKADTLKKLIWERIKLSVQTIDLRREKGFAEAQQLVASRKGKLYMDEIRNIIHAIQQEQNKLLNEQQEANRESTVAFNRSFYFLLGSILLLLIIVLLTIRHNLRVRKKAEEELKASEEKFRNLIHLSPIGITLSTASGKLLEANPEILNMMGYATKEELMKTPVSEFFVDINDREKRVELFKKQGYVKNYQSRVKRKDGRVIWVSGHAYPFKLNNGEMAMLSAQMDITEIKEADEKLFIKNEWYNQTLLSLGDGVIATDVNGIIMLINKAACELSGWSPEEAVGIHVDRVFDITNERTGLKVVNPVMEALRENKIVWLANHTMLKRKNGSTLFIDDSGAPIHNQKGEVIGGVLIFRDVTEKKKAEEELLAFRNELEEKVNKRTLELNNAVEELKRNQEMLDETGRLAKVGGWEIDLANMNVSWTDEVYRIHELEKGKMPSVEEAINFYAPEARPVIREAVNKAIATGKEYDIDLPFVTANGNNLWVRAIGKTEIKDRKAVRVFGVFQDITERKKAEEKLTETIERFKYATLASNDIIYDWDILNNTVWRNKSYYDFMGLINENNLLDLDSWSKFIHPEDHDRVLKSVSNVIDGNENYWSGEYRFLAKNKAIHYFSDRGFVMRDKDGRAFRMIGAVSDITLWKKNIQHLEEIIFSLSHKVRQPVAHILGISNLLDNELITKEELNKIAGYIKESSLTLDRFTHELTKLVSDVKSKTENKNWA